MSSDLDCLKDMKMCTERVLYHLTSLDNQIEKLDRLVESALDFSKREGPVTPIVESGSKLKKIGGGVFKARVVTPVDAE